MMIQDEDKTGIKNNNKKIKRSKKRDDHHHIYTIQSLYLFLKNILWFLLPHGNFFDIFLCNS